MLAAQYGYLSTIDHSIYQTTLRYHRYQKHNKGNNKTLNNNVPFEDLSQQQQHIDQASQWQFQFLELQDLQVPGFCSHQLLQSYQPEKNIKRHLNKLVCDLGHKSETTPIKGENVTFSSIFKCWQRY